MAPSANLRTSAARRASLALVRDRLRAAGLRWTSQRRTLVEILAGTDGHVTGAELVERCRRRDPSTIPSTVYRTLDMLEDLGFVRHGHGADGREEFHVLPSEEHGHLHCRTCGSSWELGPDEAMALIQPLEASRGFAIDLSHVTIVGRCADCRAAAAESIDEPGGDAPASGVAGRDAEDVEAAVHVDDLAGHGPSEV